MKKFGKLFLLGMLSAAILVGCSNPREELVSQARSSFASGDYPTALQSLKSASALEPFSKDEEDLSDMQMQSMQYTYEAYVKAGDSEFANKNYATAVEMYSEANKVVPSDTVTSAKVVEANLLAQNQAQFDEYAELFVEFVSESNEILREFSTYLDSYKVGVIGEKDFVVSIKGLVPKSNAIVAKIDEAFATIDESITPIHQRVIDVVDFQHRTLLNAVDVEIYIDPVSSLRNDYLKIKKDQTTLVQDMKNYAKENNLKFKFSIAEPETESDETESEPQEELNENANLEAKN